jgi:hypothetical protein
MATAWHYVQNGQSIGPVSEEKLLELISTGVLGQEDMAWHAGMRSWEAIRVIPELHKNLSKPPSPPLKPALVVDPVSPPSQTKIPRQDPDLTKTKGSRPLPSDNATNRSNPAEKRSSKYIFITIIVVLVILLLGVVSAVAIPALLRARSKMQDTSIAVPAPVTQVTQSAGSSNAADEYISLCDLTDSKAVSPKGTDDSNNTVLIDTLIKKQTHKNGKVTISAFCDGSFHLNKKNETLYLVYQEDPKASHAEGYGKYFYVITTNGDENTDFDVIPLKDEQPNHIYNKITMPDGTDAILVGGEFSTMGNTLQSAWLISFVNKSHQTLKDFGVVLNSTCGAGGDNPSTIASKISFKFEQNQLLFKREHYKQKCEDNSPWVFVEASDKPDDQYF